MKFVDSHKFAVSHRDRGQLLVEAIVAITVITVGMLSVLAFLNRSLSLSRVVSDELTGTYLASEGIEVAKNILDGNRGKGAEWNSGFRDGSFEVDYQSLALIENKDRQILFDSGSGIYGYKNGNPTQFKRTVNIAMPTKDEIKVNSIVKWKTRGSAEFEVNLEDHFFNWKR